MRSSVFVYRLLSILLVVLLLPISAVAYVYDENVSYYESLPAVEQYMKTMKSPAQAIVESDNVKGEDHRISIYRGCHEKLQALGYCLSDYNRNRYYSDDYVTAVSLFAQQMGLGDCFNGQKTTPFLRAVIMADGVAQPVIIAPINHRQYCNKNEKVYSLKELMQAKPDEMVCWKGKVADVQQLDGTRMRYTIIYESEIFVVEFTHPARSSTFLRDDNVIVYGKVTGRDDVHIQADMIAYSK